MVVQQCSFAKCYAGLPNVIGEEDILGLRFNAPVQVHSPLDEESLNFVVNLARNLAASFSA
jgi:hypothetical protein